MIMKHLKIEVITTDLADLAMQGFGSVQNCLAVSEVLRDVFPRTRLRVISSQDDLDSLAETHPDLVIAGIKYVDFSEDCGKRTSNRKIWLSKFLEEQGIEFTGSRHHAIKIEFDKFLAEKVVGMNNLNTAESFIAQPGQFCSESQLPLPLPLFIKPLFESDSKGIDQMSVAKNFHGFMAKVQQIWSDFREPALAETYLPGREFTVAILQAGSSFQPDIMPIEICSDYNGCNDHFLEFSTKHENRERFLMVEDAEIKYQIEDLAYRAFIAIGARDFGRIDIKMNEKGEPCFLEANLVPGMNRENSYFPIACSACSQRSYTEIVNHMILPAIWRFTSSSN